jgi:DDE superfamily endonuclease
MVDAKELWKRWQALLNRYTFVFTRPGWVRFVDWVTGMVLCWEEHTITQLLTAMEMADRWRVLEHFAEYGAFNRVAVEQATIRLLEEQQPARFAGYHPVALDDTKEHRSSANVWGTCTFHEPAGRSPNRASTVRAHNWVVMGDLVPGKPWTYLPHTARLYFRKSQLPAGEEFRKKTTWAVEMLRQVDAESTVPILGVFDGAYANRTVIRPCLNPAAGQRRIDVVTRLREDAQLHASKAAVAKKKRGRPRLWGKRLPAPKDHEKWKQTTWQESAANIYGRARSIRYKQLDCYWTVTGPKELVHVFVFEVEGYDEPWYIVTTALSLSAEQTVEVFAARFRQEDGFRDHKQRLGMEECRAWTKEPILRTFTVQMVAQTLLRLLAYELDAEHGPKSWWSPPEWNKTKSHPSVLDARRLLWRYREEFSEFLLELEESRKVAAPAARAG